MYVRAIYIPLCKKISSWPPPPPPRRPYLSVSSRLSTPFPPFLSSCRVSRLSRPPLEPPARRYPRVCNANTHQPDVLANCLCFYRARIFLRPRRGARHHAFPVKRLPLDFLSTRRTREGSSSEILEVWIFFVWIFFSFFWKSGREGSFPRSRVEGRSKIGHAMEKWKLKERAERFFWGCLRVN